MKTIHEVARFSQSWGAAMPGIFPEFIDGYGILVLATTGRYFHVPYRSLVRSMGGDRVSHAAVRNMMDIEAVQTALRRQGARIQ